MNATPRQKVLLGILGFLVLIVLWQLIAPAGDEGGDTAAPPSAASVDDEGDGPVRRQLPGSRRGNRREKVEDVTELHLANLDVQPRDYTPGRDPWRYYEPPPPGPSPEELARQRAEAERQRLLAEQRRQEELRRQQELLAQQQQNPPEPPVPQPPPFPYKYLGNIGPPGNPIAVFSDSKTILNRRQGGVIDGKFVVSQIGYESVDIQFIGFPNTPAQRLALGR